MRNFDADFRINRKFLLYVILLIMVIFPRFEHDSFTSVYADSSGIFNARQNPYTKEKPTDNIFYMPMHNYFRTLDPAVAYSSVAYQIMSLVYEPPFSYHYLKRPYELVPQTARRMPDIKYFQEIINDKGKKAFEQCSETDAMQTASISSHSQADPGKEKTNIEPKSAKAENDEKPIPPKAEPGNKKKLTGRIRTVYNIKITPGIIYQPHPLNPSP